MGNSTLEALKEIGRWILLFVISWIISSIITQAQAVPEFLNLKVWVFVFQIPLRELFTFSFTFIGRFVDKYVHEKGKEIGDKAKGLLPF